MNITRRRGAIATFITLGILLVGVAVTLNIRWIVLNERKVTFAVLGIILFAPLITGVVLNTVFLVREVRRNERQDSFLKALTRELKTPMLQNFQALRSIPCFTRNRIREAHHEIRIPSPSAPYNH